MEDDMQRMLLSSIEVRQLANGCGLHRVRHKFWLVPPPVIAHVIDVAVGAVEVAPARHLEQYGVNHVKCHDRSEAHARSLCRAIILASYDLS